MGLYQVLHLLLSEDLGVTVMKEYFKLLKSSELETHHSIQFYYYTQDIAFEAGGVKILLRKMQSVYTKPCFSFVFVCAAFYA